jgi:hypothetical protein
MEKKVSVVWDGTYLKIEPNDIELGDGDWVRWSFEGIEKNDFGFISFQTRFGPFHSLRSFANASVLGKGNTGPANVNAYPYQAMILDPNADVPVAQAGGTINNVASKTDTAPEVLVYYNADTKTLQLAPETLGLNPGDTATWYFMNLPDDAFACFRFDPLVPGMSETFGPFVDFYACGGNGLVDVRASGTGFAALPAMAENDSFTYHIQVRDSQGKLLASHDPAIDNLGPPPPPPE